MPLRISLSGAPVMWKEVVASKLADEYKLMKIDIKALVA